MRRVGWESWLGELCVESAVVHDQSILLIDHDIYSEVRMLGWRWGDASGALSFLICSRE